MPRKFRWLCLPVCLLLILGSLALAAPLDEIYRIIENQSIFAVEKEQLHSTPLEGLPALLGDPYFKYFDPAAFAEYIGSYQGVYGGVGTQIARLGHLIFVEKVYPGTPAAEEGVLKGDVIIRVDGRLVEDLAIDAVAALLRGEPGSEVTVTLLRGSAMFDVTLTRRVIESQTVEGFMLGEVAVITIHSFQDKSPDQFRAVIADLQQKDPVGYLLDLRNNLGGSLVSVLEIARELIPRGPLVSLRGKDGRETVYLSYADPAPLGKTVVLVNSNTASSAEILAAAIAERGVGMLVGEKTYGKASVQSVYRLSDNSGLRLTTARYFTPIGQAIDGEGLEPEITVSGREAQLTAALTQFFELRPASLLFTLDNPIIVFQEREVTADHPPFLLNSRSYVPLRLLAQAMGLAVEWNAFAYEVTLRGEAVEVNIPINGDVALKNGFEFPLGGQAVLRNDRTFIPVRSVAEVLGARVYWNGEARQVTVAWE